METCADPDILHSPAGDPQWYLYCTTDPHNTGDRDASGNLNFHLISMAKSTDLVNWTYVDDAFTARPTWGEFKEAVTRRKVKSFHKQRGRKVPCSDSGDTSGGLSPPKLAWGGVSS